MKKLFALLSLTLISLFAHSQTCYYTATMVSAPATYSFVPAGTTSANSSLLWNFGDGSSIISNLPTHTFNQSGTYTVTLSELDSTLGNVICSYTSTITVSFCNVSYYQDSTNANLFYFSTHCTTPPTQVYWDFGDNTVGTGVQAFHQYNSPGVYTVTVSEEYNGQIYCSNSMLISNVGSCSYQVSSPSPSSPPYVKLFTAITPISNGLAIWDFGDGSPLVNGMAVQKSYATPGTYNVCLTFIHGIDTCNYCSAVTITGGSNGNCFFNATPISWNTYDFSAGNINSGNTFNFNFGDGTSQSGNGIITHTYNAPGVYNVCLTEIDSNGLNICTSCIPVIVQNAANSCQANFSYSNSGLTAYFINQSVANPALGTPISYAWDFGDGSTSSNAFPQHTYANYGAYNVCLTVSNANCTTSFCDSVVIDTVSNPNGTNCNAYFVFTQTSSYQISAVVMNAANSLNYSWDFGDGSAAVNQLYTTHQYANAGTYVVCLTVSSFLGCNNTYCDTLTVDTAGNIIYKGVVTGFTLQTTTPTILTGLDANSQSLAISLQPNPAREQIAIKGLTETDYNYIISNTLGQEILKGNITSQQALLNIELLSNGIYHLQISNSRVGVITKKFVKN